MSVGRFTELVRPHLPRLYAYALRLCCDRDAASDISQDGLVKAYQNFAAYDPSRPVLPWLLTLVRHAFIDRVRSFDPLRTADDADDPAFPMAGGVDPSHAASSAERAAIVERALQAVPVDQRSCLVLYHVEGLTLEEISDAEGIPVGTVKSRLHRGRAALAEALGDRVNDL